jgi:mannosyltransferase
LDDRDWNVTRSWVIGLTLVALVLRFIALDSQLWTDEVLSLVRYVRKPLEDLFTHFYSNNQHPLYSLLARATMDVFGESPWTLRVWAALLGAACIPALYQLGAEVASKREAFLSAALLAVSYHHVWFSQNARGYTAIMLASIVCTYLMHRGLRDPQPKFFVLYAIVGGLGTYAHLAMVFTAVGHAAIVAPYLIRNVRPARRWVAPLLAFPGAAVVTLMLHAPMLTDVIDFFVNKPSPAVGLATPLWAAIETVMSLVEGFGGIAILGGVVVLIAGALGALGFFDYLETNPLALGLFIGPVVITGLGVMTGRGIVYPRFFFGVAAFAILIFLRGGFRLGGLLNKPRLGEVLAIVLIVASAASVPINYLKPKQDFEGAMAYVEENKSERDTVASVGIIYNVYEGYYGRPWPKVWSKQQILERAEGHDGVWLLYMFPDYIKHVNADLMSFVKAECQRLEWFPGTLRGGGVRACYIPTPKGPS